MSGTEGRQFASPERGGLGHPNTGWAASLASTTAVGYKTAANLPNFTGPQRFCGVTIEGRNASE